MRAEVSVYPASLSDFTSYHLAFRPLNPTQATLQKYLSPFREFNDYVKCKIMPIVAATQLVTAASDLEMLLRERFYEASVDLEDYLKKCVSDLNKKAEIIITRITETDPFKGFPPEESEHKN